MTKCDVAVDHLNNRKYTKYTTFNPAVKGKNVLSAEIWHFYKE